MSKNKEFKYRIICPICNKPFDSRTGNRLSTGYICCPNCTNYTTHINSNKYNIGFKFKPNFKSDIDFFEIYKIEKNIIYTIVNMNNGSSFNSFINKEEFDSAFKINEYIPL